MKFQISPTILRDYPGLNVGIIVAHGGTNTQGDTHIDQMLTDIQEKLRKELQPQDVATHPHIANWIEAYKKFGVNPKKNVPSVQNLANRVLKKPLPSINPFVDLYNYISLKYLLPLGGQDIDILKGDLQLTVASDHEVPVILLGEQQEKAPNAGEVIYKDDLSATCRAWNWKEVERTKLTPQTTNAIFVIECLPPVAPVLLESALNELAGLLEEYCNVTASVAILNEKNTEVEITHNNTFVPLRSVNKSLITSVDVYAHKAEYAVPHEHVSDEHKMRLEKIEAMRAMGIEPWPAGKAINATCHEVVSEYVEDIQSRVYEVSGRVMTLRGHGKTIFANMQDRSGTVQIYIKHDEIGDELFNQFNSFVDIGDIVWVSGHSFKTKMGEITIRVTNFALQSKSLYPMPDKFHGLADIEVKYRQRYLDLISSSESRTRFIKRSHIVRAMRNYFDSHDFIEVETPMLHPIPGGAAAKPFVTHHNALDSQFYLRIAPELYLKRLVVGGMERVYEINRNFRNEGISTRHNPEFTMVEFYIAYKDYIWVMDFVDTLIKRLAMESCGMLQLQYGNHMLDFEKPFLRLSMKDAVLQYGKLTEDDLLDNNIDAVFVKHNIALQTKNASWGQKLVTLFEHFAEPNLIQPTFITHFPIEISPLSKRDPQDPSIAGRFELFIGGIELSNGFNELNDPFDQASRFADQAKAHAAGDDEAHHFDAEYVHALEYALPPTVGVGIGIDRLVMFLTNTTSIKDVILFPTLKKKQ